MSGSYERLGAGRVKTAEETAESRKRIRGFWHHCEHPRGTPVEHYLRRRRLAWLIELPGAIRFRPECPHPSGHRLSAMVALIMDGAGDIAALHRTYLTSAGYKADVAPVKATKGSFSGGAIRLHPACAEIVVGEGIETTAAAAQILELPAWAGISCGNLRASLVLPEFVRTVTIAADHDGPGRRAAAGAARRWRSEGRTVRIVQPDKPGQDFNDVLRARAEASYAG